VFHFAKKKTIFFCLISVEVHFNVVGFNFVVVKFKIMKKISLSKSNSDVRPNKIRDRLQNNDNNKNVTISNNNGFSKQWNDVKSGWRKFKLKRWNSIGSWVKTALLSLLSSRLKKFSKIFLFQFLNYIFFNIYSIESRFRRNIRFDKFCCVRRKLFKEKTCLSTFIGSM
jgi:hypothetical protein